MQFFTVSTFSMYLSCTFGIPFAVITSAVEVQFTGFLLYFLLYFDKIYLQCILEKVLLLKGFIHCKHSKTTTFCRVLISIAHLAFNECYNCSGFTVYSVLLHLNCIFFCIYLQCSSSSWRILFNNTLFQLFSVLLTIFFFQFPIKFIDVFCYLQIWEVWLQRLEEMKSSLRVHISMHNVKVCFPNCLLPPY